MVPGGLQHLSRIAQTLRTQGGNLARYEEAHLENLRTWLQNVDGLCGNVLREPTSGFHKMNLAQALRRSERVMVAAGRGQKAGQPIARLVEIVDTVRRQIWDSQYALSDHYLEALRGLIEGLRREVVALIAEIEGNQNHPDSSLSTDQPLVSQGHVEKIASTPATARRRRFGAGDSPSSIHRSLWTGFLKSFGKSAGKE
jgi:hypothetical protein